MDDCLQQGFETAWLWIMPHNRHSFVVHNRLGMSHVFRKIVLHQRWGMRWHHFEDMDISVNELLPELPGKTGT
jgi:hypothetical protein